MPLKLAVYYPQTDLESSDMLQNYLSQVPNNADLRQYFEKTVEYGFIAPEGMHADQLATALLAYLGMSKHAKFSVWKTLKNSWKPFFALYNEKGLELYAHPRENLFETFTELQPLETRPSMQVDESELDPACRGMDEGNPDDTDALSDCSINSGYSDGSASPLPIPEPMPLTPFVPETNTPRLPAGTDKETKESSSPKKVSFLMDSEKGAIIKPLVITDGTLKTKKILEVMKSEETSSLFYSMVKESIRTDVFSKLDLQISELFPAKFAENTLNELTEESSNFVKNSQFLAFELGYAFGRSDAFAEGFGTTNIDTFKDQVSSLVTNLEEQNRLEKTKQEIIKRPIPPSIEQHIKSTNETLESMKITIDHLRTFLLPGVKESELKPVSKEIKTTTTNRRFIFAAADLSDASADEGKKPAKTQKKKKASSSESSSSKSETLSSESSLDESDSGSDRGSNVQRYLTPSIAGSVKGKQKTKSSTKSSKKKVKSSSRSLMKNTVFTASTPTAKEGENLPSCSKKCPGKDGRKVSTLSVDW